tara:strand:+ start:311 stop:1003 length:693 start_codon:yes stop_codon:yes gene_type:complete
MHPLTKYLSLQTILLDVFVPHQVHELTYFFVCTTQMWDSQRRLHELRYRALSLTAQVPAMEHRPLIPPVKEIENAKISLSHYSHHDDFLEGKQSFLKFLDLSQFENIQKQAVERILPFLKKKKHIFVYKINGQIRYRVTVEKNKHDVTFRTYESNDPNMNEKNMNAFVSEAFLFHHLLGMNTLDDKAIFVMTNVLPDDFEEVASEPDDDFVFRRKITHPFSDQAANSNNQ